MATLEELVIKLEADNAKLISALDESAKVTAKSSKMMEDSISKFTEASTKNTNKFGDVMTVFAGTTLANLAVKGAELAGAAFGFLKDNIAEGIGEAAQFEQEMVKLANSMAMSGKFTAEASKDLEKWIGDMETLSGVDDAVIAGNLAMLSSMTKLDSEGLKRAQQSALDLSAALGIDLNTATKLVGKAAEGSTDGFKRYGVVIAESADKSLTFANTLSTLEGRFAGASGGAMKSFQGTVTGLTNSFGNLFQSMGDVVVKNPAIIAAIGEITKIISGMTSGVVDNAGAWRKQLAEALSTTLVIIGTVAKGSEELVRVMVAGFKTIYLGVQAVVDSFQAMGEALKGNFKGALDQFKETGDAFDSLANTTNVGGNTISNTLIDIASASVEATRTMSDSMLAVAPTIKATGEAMKELTWIEQKRRDASKEFSIGLAEDSFNVQKNYEMQSQANQLAYETQGISFETYKANSLTSQADMFAQEQAMLQSSLSNKQITEQQFQLSKTQLDAQQGAARNKMEADFNKSRAENFKSTMGTISTLSQSGNKELAAIGKAAAITSATIDGYAAVQKAIASGVPPFNFAMAALVGAAAAANVAKIAGVGLAGGIDSVPGVGSKDNFPAVLAPGERVVPSESNKDLTDFLARQGDSQASPTFNLNFYGPVWGDKATAGAEIVEAINEALARGMSLRILST